MCRPNQKLSPGNEEICLVNKIHKVRKEQTKSQKTTCTWSELNSTGQAVSGESGYFHQPTYVLEKWSGPGVAWAFCKVHSNQLITVKQ